MTITEHDHAESDQAGSVTVLGRGLMGRALANAFLTAGHPTTVTFLGSDPGLAALESGIATTTGWLAGYAEQIDTGTFPGDDSTIATHLAAMTHLVEESKARGVSTTLPAQIQAVAERAVADGLGESGYAAIISQFRGRS